MKNKIKVTLLLGLIILFGVKLQSSFAEDSYQFELEPEYMMLEDDDNNEATGYGLTGRFFFWPVKIGDHPYAEDAFLDRVGSIELFYGRVDAEFDIGGAEVEGDGPEYGARLIYMRPGSPIFFQAEYLKSELEIDLDDFGLDAVEIEGDEYEIQLGWFLGKTFRAALAYAHAETDTDDESEEEDRYALLAKYVHELGDERAFNLEGEIGLSQFDDGADDGSNTDFSILGDFYFNRSISLGAGFGINSGDDESAEGKTFLIRGNAFVTPKVGIRAAWEQFSADNDAGIDEDTLSFALLIRI